MSINAFKKKNVYKKDLLTIRWICGFEIMLVPNAKKMNDAIEAHLKEHKQKISNPKASQAEVEHLRDYLITLVFEEASKA